MSCLDGYTQVTLISETREQYPYRAIASICVLDELLADDHYRPAIMGGLRRTRDQYLRERVTKIDPATMTEEWWSGDIDDPAAFIRNREPKRLEWS